MSIEEARAKILEFRDFLINIDRANAMADALPNIAINILLITIILSSALILYEFMYVFLYNVSVIMNVIMAIAYSLISAYVIYIIAVKVPRKIRNAGKDAAVRYAHWDRLLNEVYQALLPYLNL